MYETRDVTDICKSILEGMKLINAVGNRANRGRVKSNATFTVRHFVDILKGSEHKKITENGK